jgi:hypothetical protein
MSEEKKNAVALAITIEGDKAVVYSDLPKLVQIGLLLDTANQLLAKIVMNMTDEEVRSLDNKKVQ